MQPTPGSKTIVCQISQEKDRKKGIMMSREKRPEENRLRAKEDRLESSRRIDFRGLVLRQANMTKF
jgi:hypothetical protein